MEELLKNFGEDAPSGKNLEYETVFADLLLVAQPGEERQVGDEIMEAEAPDDNAVIEKALAVLEQSHDLRAAVYLASAELRKNGFSGFAKVTSYMRGCLEQYWDSCHPELDADDDNDPTMRVNTVLGIADSDTMVKLVRRAPLTQSKAFGGVTLRDMAVADGEVSLLDGTENIPDQAGIGAAFKDTDPEVLAGIQAAVAQALEDVRGMDAVFDEKTPGMGPNLDPLIKMLQRAATRLAEETGVEAVELVEDDEDGTSAGSAAAKSAPSGAISSPRDVEASIDRIIAYYTIYEPSSPVPLLLQRAKRLVGADFMTIVNDIAADGVHNVKLVGGIVDE
ncbi:MAG: type VI secretion system protein TssA [Amylibacter sp.]